MTVFEQHTHEQLQRASQHICDLTLRDLFAMSALAGFCANEKLNHHSEIEMSKFSYDFADAMLKVRDEK